MSTYNSADQLEKSISSRPEDKYQHLEKQRTVGGHEDDRSQPALPIVHRSFTNPAPLGLLSFATGIFLISIFGVQARSVQTPNVIIGVLMFFGGVCQFIAGIMEFISGNTVSKKIASMLRLVHLHFLVRCYSFPIVWSIQSVLLHGIFTRLGYYCQLHRSSYGYTERAIHSSNSILPLGLVHTHGHLHHLCHEIFMDPLSGSSAFVH